MSTNKAHRKFVSNLLGTSSTKNIQPCINGKTLSLDFVRKRRPKQEHRVIPSRKYTSASGDIYVPYTIADNPLAQHLHQLAVEAMNAPNDHVEDIDSTPSQRPISNKRNRLVREERARNRNTAHRTSVKLEHKSRSEIRRQSRAMTVKHDSKGHSDTKLGNKTKYITAQQQLLTRRGTHSVIKRPAPSVKVELARQQNHVSNTVVHETPVTPRVMFAGSTPGCELMRDTPQRSHNDTCHSSELQFDSSPMILTNGWSTCHSATPHTSARDQQTVPRDNSIGSVNDSSDSVNANDTPPSTFKWQVIESMTREPYTPSSPCPAEQHPSTPKQRTIQRLFQQNCYLKRRVRDLTQHLLRANKTQFL